MPSRGLCLVIVLFWVGTLGWVGYQQVLPRLLRDAPPAVQIDLADEAAQSLPSRWTVYRGTQRIGTLNTRTQYDEKLNTFAYISSYQQLQFQQNSLTVLIPDLTMTMIVNRAGELRGQEMIGTIKGKYQTGPLTIFESSAQATIKAVVSAGQLTGTVSLSSDFGSINEPLEPVPVPAGQVLNPLQPVNRLRDVRPGQRWVVHEIDPLGRAFKTLGEKLFEQKAGAALAGMAKRFAAADQDEELIAEVGSRSEMLTRKDDTTVECWVIEYRRAESKARTWVSVADGKVLQQEATFNGETLRLVRED